MEHKVSKMREMGRGLEAEVTLGTVVPGGFVRMQVTLSPLDAEYQTLKSQLHALFARRAEEALLAVVETTRLREEKVAPTRRSA